VTERYLPEHTARDVIAVVTELVDCVGRRRPAPRTLRLELAVTEAVVRVSVTAQLVKAGELTSNKSLREALPVTSSLASRYGIEAGHRIRLWAEFDRTGELVA
jgi:hypothetical protein